METFWVLIPQDLQQRQNARQQDFRSKKFLNLQDGLVNEHLRTFMRNLSKKIFREMYLEVLH